MNFYLFYLMQKYQVVGPAGAGWLHIS